LRDIKVLHLEPTDVCQAACPLCARETDANFRKDQQHHLDMHKILQVFDTDQIAALDKMFMCGNYGDPAAGQHTLDIYCEFRQLNPDIVLGMNTNGALKNASWWYKLGTIFNRPRDYVVFSIDGLEDTNHIYRKNVDWHKLMTNVQSYISAGGLAHWDMLVYEHNQHQVDACKQLAQDLGFKWFRAKVSKRSFTENLKAPSGWSRIPVKSTDIECRALKEQSRYIDAKGRVSPCCWIGNTQKEFIKTFEEIQQSWNTNTPHTICSRTCGTTAGSTNFTNQWQQQIQF
jgi:sulfatase maturation enzyme AslB (radical SAM superfamily)